jgi:hypothetical protein
MGQYYFEYELLNMSSYAMDFFFSSDESRRYEIKILRFGECFCPRRRHWGDNWSVRTNTSAQIQLRTTCIRTHMHAAYITYIRTYMCIHTYIIIIIIIIRGATALTKLGRLSRRYWVDMWSSTSNPTATFSTFQTGPLLLYSSNYSVYPITRLSGPRSRPNSLRNILRSARESNPGPLCL